MEVVVWWLVWYGNTSPYDGAGSMVTIKKNGTKRTGEEKIIGGFCATVFQWTSVERTTCRPSSTHIVLTYAGSL